MTNTSIGALERGFEVFVAADAHSTWPTDEDDAEAIVQRQNDLLSKRGALVETTASIAERLSREVIRQNGSS